MSAVVRRTRLLFFKAKLAQFANTITREQLFQLAKATHGISYRALNDILTRGCVPLQGAVSTGCTTLHRCCGLLLSRFTVNG